MLKSILKLNGAQELSKKEQKNIQGAGRSSRRCCEWCSDGSCLDWVDGNVTCPISAGCYS